MAVIVPDKKNIYIYGAGGFGRELESYLLGEKAYGKEYEIKGYIDEVNTDMRGYPSEFSVQYKNIEHLMKFGQNDYILIAIADVYNRKRIFNLLKKTK